jgi:hypothetical protein
MRRAFELLATLPDDFNIPSRSKDLPQKRPSSRARRSRSKVSSDALKEFLACYAPKKITEAMNKACAEIGDTNDVFVRSAARRILERSQW